MARNDNDGYTLQEYIDAAEASTLEEAIAYWQNVVDRDERLILEGDYSEEFRQSLRELVSCYRQVIDALKRLADPLYDLQATHQRQQRIKQLQARIPAIFQPK